MLPESKLCQNDVDVFSLMVAVSGDLGVIDLKFTSKSTFEYTLFSHKS